MSFVLKKAFAGIPHERIGTRGIPIQFGMPKRDPKSDFLGGLFWSPCSHNLIAKAIENSYLGRPLKVCFPLFVVGNVEEHAGLLLTMLNFPCREESAWELSVDQYALHLKPLP